MPAYWPVFKERRYAWVSPPLIRASIVVPATGESSRVGAGFSQAEKRTRRTALRDAQRILLDRLPAAAGIDPHEPDAEISGAQQIPRQGHAERAIRVGLQAAVPPHFVALGVHDLQLVLRERRAAGGVEDDCEQPGIRRDGLHGRAFTPGRAGGVEVQGGRVELRA